MPTDRVIKAATIEPAASNELRAQDGGALFSQLCSTCHDGGNERAPKREVLRQLASEQARRAGSRLDDYHGRAPVHA